MPINPKRRDDLNDFEIVAARHYVQDRMSTAEIAERMGCSRGRVADALKRCKIPTEKRAAMYP
jgi:predicted DNA-binding protein YlxM (UPF0122 family)